MERCACSSRSGTEQEAGGRQTLQRGLGGKSLLSEDNFYLNTNMMCWLFSSDLPSPLASSFASQHTYFWLIFLSIAPHLIILLFFSWSVTITVSLGSVSPLTNLFPSAPAFGSLGPSFGQFVQPGAHSFRKPCKRAAGEGIASHGKQKCPCSKKAGW